MRRCRGRARDAIIARPKSPSRSPFQRDRDRIIHSTAFRRLKHKTQVFVVPRGRPLPHAPDPFARGGADRAHDLPRAAPRRGSRRGAGAGPRSRPPAVRPCRRGGAERRHGALWRLRPQRPDAAHRDQARGALCRVRRAEPDLGDAGGRGQAQRPAARSPAGRWPNCPPPSPSTARTTTSNSTAMPGRRRRSRRSPTTSPTTTTTSTTGCAPACSSVDGPARPAAGRRDVRAGRAPQYPGIDQTAPDPRGGAPRDQRHGRRRGGRDAPPAARSAAPKSVADIRALGRPVVAFSDAMAATDADA